MFTTGNEIVDRIGQIHFEGNVVPHTWRHTIVKETGKPYALAILILADIVYWYRPTIDLDEATNQVVRFRKRFKSDLLQRSYAQLSEMFGITKRDATNVIVFLEKLGVVQRHFRTIEYDGIIANNVLFIELKPDRLLEVTYPTSVTPITEIGDTLSPKSGTPSHQNWGDPLTENGETNTEITTKITTKITTENIKDNNMSSKVPAGAYETIISHLNKAIGKHYKHTTPKTRSDIQARFREGYVVDDFIKVIDWKTKQWLTDPHYSKYLRPETLFGGKFDRYRNEIRNGMVLSDGTSFRPDEIGVAEDETLPF